MADDGGAGEQHSGGPHAFFWVTCAILALGLLAAGTAGSRAPSFALLSEVVYRIEIGAVVVAVSYGVAVMLWLAWHGRTLRRVELPGIGALETPVADLDAAARDVQALATGAAERLDGHDAAIAELDLRLADLEHTAE
jgi:hypothetical protein